MRITKDDIRQLRDEAGEAGDREMVKICNKALRGDKEAWAECEYALKMAKAMHDESVGYAASRFDELIEGMMGDGIVQESGSSKEAAAKRTVKNLSHIASLLQKLDPASKLNDIAMYMVTRRAMSDDQAQAIIDADESLDSLGKIMSRISYAHRKLFGR